MLSPILAAALLGFGGLGLVLAVDLATFAFAFFVLLLFIRIPDSAGKKEEADPGSLGQSMKEAAAFLKGQKGIRLLLVLYSVLEFLGAVSFDSMYSPLLLARTERSLWESFLPSRRREDSARVCGCPFPGSRKGNCGSCSQGA